MRVGEGIVDPAESLAPALRRAWNDALSLLLRPFSIRKWVKLGLICFFLGGGTPWAIVNWSAGSLTPSVTYYFLLERARETLAGHAWLAIPIVALGLAAGLALLYVRALGRFVLVDSILGREVRIRRAWRSNRRLGRSYFIFLAGGLAILGVAFGILTLALFPHLQMWALERPPWFPLVVAGLLGAIILTATVVALAIMLTDDIVVPTMYAERIGLARAWGELLRWMSREPATFGLYILARIGLAVVTGAAVLVFFFPMLLAIFSGVLLAEGLGRFALGALGVAWLWNAGTLALATAAAGAVSAMLLAALSLAQMPAQVFLQDFGIQFIASSVPSLAALINPAADDDQPGDQTLSA